jgi:hypothetical protein
VDHASPRGRGAEDREISSVFASNVARLAVHGSIDKGENVHEKEGGIIDQYANADADKPKDWNEEPEKCILRSQKKIVSRKVKRSFG